MDPPTTKMPNASMDTPAETVEHTTEDMLTAATARLEHLMTYHPSDHSHSDSSYSTDIRDTESNKLVDDSEDAFSDALTPLELTADIGLTPTDLAVLRALNPSAGTHNSNSTFGLHDSTVELLDFMELFDTLKISFCQVSIDVLIKISTNDILAPQVKHVIFGTETLEQYHPIIDAAAEKDEEGKRKKLLFYQWLDDEYYKRRDIMNSLLAALYRFSNLRTVTVEDRPINGEKWRESLGHAKIREEIGVDLRWNGPYTEAMHTLDNNLHIFPKYSRQWVYVSAMILARQIEVPLDLIIGTVRLSRCDDDVDEEVRYFAMPFDPLKEIPREALDDTVRNIEIRNVPHFSRLVYWSSVHGNIDEYHTFLMTLASEAITFNDCSLRLEDFGTLRFSNITSIDIRNCNNATALGVFVDINRHRLLSLALTNVEMYIGDADNGYNQWRQFFEALATTSVLERVEFSYLRTGVLSCKTREEEECIGSRKFVVWNNNDAIRAAAWEMREVVRNFEHLKAVLVPAVIDLETGETAFRKERYQSVLGRRY
jgi:hypothetical protein